MSNTTSSAASGGIGLGGAVFLVLLTLKLTKLAAISWFWVFFPLWIGLAVVLGIAAGFMLVAGFFWVVAHLVDALSEARRARRFDRRLKKDHLGAFAGPFGNSFDKQK